VRLDVQRRRGGRRRLSVPLRIPASLRPGVRTLVLAGSSETTSEADIVVELVGALFGISGQGDGGRDPRSARELARAVRRLHRPLGIEARFKHIPTSLVVRSDDVSYGGRVRLPLRVLRRSH
jgi:hypothetical protein